MVNRNNRHDSFEQKSDGYFVSIQEEEQQIQILRLQYQKTVESA